MRLITSGPACAETAMSVEDAEHGGAALAEADREAVVEPAIDPPTPSPHSLYMWRRP